jgi:RNA polymerase sigma-70 factor (ECF subfamily)
MNAGESDASLIERFQTTGDVAAFEVLFARHRDSLFAFLMRLALNRSVAEDVSQQTWLQILEAASRRSLRAVGAASFRTYLLTLGRNRFIDGYCRSHAVTRSQLLDDAVLETIADPEASADEVIRTLDRDQLKRVLSEAMAELPFPQREVIALWAEGTDTETMAALVDAPLETVLSRKKYGLTRLRAALARRGVKEALT